jgi:porphobilinogen synthase
MAKRPTRLRVNTTMRQMVKETRLHMDMVVYPVFLVEGLNIKEEITSMKDQYHFSVDQLLLEIPYLQEKGIHRLLLFASTLHKSSDGSSGYDSEGLVQRAISALKKEFPELMLIADVCLCQYKEDGHCCVYDDDVHIDRKKTLEVLSKVALSYAQAGADMVAPSDMMDGRVAAIRKLLDQKGYEHIAIMAYSAKYASAFYGPFREAAHSAPSHGDRKSYQMDPSNRIEAKREMALDLEEGADILMVKPAMPYLDIIREAKEWVNVPLAAYQVSGEYAIIRNGVDQGVIDERAIYESLIGICRSGASIIITYFAKEIQRLMNSEARL